MDQEETGEQVDDMESPWGDPTLMRAALCVAKAAAAATDRRQTRKVRARPIVYTKNAIGIEKVDKANEGESRAREANASSDAPASANDDESTGSAVRGMETIRKTLQPVHVPRGPVAEAFHAATPASGRRSRLTSEERSIRDYRDAF